MVKYLIAQSSWILYSFQLFDLPSNWTFHIVPSVSSQDKTLYLPNISLICLRACWNLAANIVNYGDNLVLFETKSIWDKKVFWIGAKDKSGLNNVRNASAVAILYKPNRHKTSNNVTNNMY